MIRKSNLGILYDIFFNISIRKHALGILFILFSFNILIAQNVKLINPSFEDTPSDATMPMGWFACEEYTTPDILPGYWGVYHEPSDGDTFVGIITRDNGTWEAIGQRFSEKMEKGDCYSFNIDIATSESYAGYNVPIKLKIWISDTKCKRKQLVYVSGKVESEDWETIRVKFTCESDIEYIMFEAVYSHGNRQNGNVLLDNMSPIYICNKA